MLSYVWACLTCSSQPSLTIKSHKYSIVRLLGDGGYAYVYLVNRDGTDKQFALKKIRCMFGGESVASAMREVEACHVFKTSDRVVSCIESAVIQEADGTKTVYIVLPYYAEGNLQDLINANVVNGTDFREPEVIEYALETARALEVMHTHRKQPGMPASRRSSEVPNSYSSNDRASEEYEGLLAGESDESGVSMGDLQPYAHRDIKPANIMVRKLSPESGAAKLVLIDLGSCSPARVDISTRQQALEMQDIAAEHCTLPYRAPELFDVRTGIRIDEKVDIWGLGCTIYTLMYSVSPFEREEQVAGANVNLAIARGKFSFPDRPAYSPELKSIISQCLQVDPVSRPSVGALIDQLDELQQAAR